jgi:hypothetical protein
MSNYKSYANSVALTKLQHGFITTKKGARCIVIPIEENYLTEKDGCVYMQTDVVVREEKDANDNWGFQAQKLPSEIFKELGSEKAKELKLPYLGNLKIFERKSNDSVEAQVMDEEEHDDLPF